MGECVIVILFVVVSCQRKSDAVNTVVQVEREGSRDPLS